MKKITAVNASPRKGGNTEILLSSFLSGAEEAGSEIVSFVLEEMEFSPCKECEGLGNNRKCVVHDELQELFPEAEDADILVLAAPIFFGSLSAQAKMMIDRFQCHWRAKEILKIDLGQKRKKGVFLCVEASAREDFLQNAKSIVKNYFATVNAEYSAEIFCTGVDIKEAILNRPEVLEEAKALGRRLAV